MYRNVIFDFDGTIADTLPRTYQIANELAREAGREGLAPLEQLRRMSAREFITALNLPMYRILRYARRIQEDLRQNMHLVRPFPRIREAMETLKSRGIRIGIVSSNTPENVHAFLEQTKLPVDFIHAKPSIFGKHHRIKATMRKLGMSIHDTLYIGDEVRDIDACKKLKLDIGVVTWGFNSKDILALQNPNYLFTTPTQIVAAVRP